MTTLNFPAAPSAGATHNASNGLQYTYDGVKWTSQGAYATGLTQPLKLDDISSQFNGSLTTFNLTVSSAGVNIYKAESVTISLGGVIQEPTTAYTINTAAGTITFATAPAAGTTFFGLLSSTIQSTVVADGAISTAKIQDDAVTTAKLADDCVTIHQIADNAVGINQIGDNAVGSNQIVAQAIFNSDINNSAAIAQSKLNIADATTSASGYMSGSDKTKLDGIENNATADQTASEIRTLVESATDSNVFTDADHAKLNAIEANATADQTAAEIRTLVESATDSNVFTDADHTKLNDIDVTDDKLSVDSNNKFIFTGTSGQYPTITIKHSDNTVEGEVLRFRRTDSPLRFNSIKAKNHASDTDENYLSFHIHDRDTDTSQVEQLKITPNSVLLNYDGTTKAQTSANGLDLPDNSKLQLGSSQDLKIYHDGTHSYLQKGDGTGNLYVDANGIILRGANGETLTSFTENGAVELYHDNIKRCETSADGLDLPDNSKLQLGDAQDLQIFHNGSNSIIKDSGTGFLLLDTNTLMVRKVDGTETMAKFTANGAAELYYDNVKKVETSADGLNLPTNSKLQLGGSQDLKIYHDGTHSIISNSTGNIKLEPTSGAKGIVIVPNQQAELYYNNIKRLETTDTGALISGRTGSDPALHIKHSNINVEGEVIRFARLDSAARYHSINASQSNTTANNFIKFNIHTGAGAASPYTAQITQLLIDDDKVSLSYDGTEKLATTSNGITVTGSVTATAMTISDGQPGLIFEDTNADPDFILQNRNGLFTIRNISSSPGVNRFHVDASNGDVTTTGNILPNTDDDVALGSSTKRFTTLHSVALNTGDINMSNLSNSPNEVDGTKGSWTLQEGSDDLFLINRVNGKKYKFNLTEIN